MNASKLKTKTTMSLSTLTERMQTLVGDNSSLGATIKFVTDAGVVYVDATTTPPQVHNEDKEAECVVELSAEDAQKLLDGDLNPMSAFMMGKLKVKGNMGVAMKFMQIVS